MSTVHDTTQQFDYARFKRAYERLDPASVADMLADDFQCIEVDSKSPPSNPRVIHGRDDLIAAIEGVAASGLDVKILDEVIGEDKVAWTAQCTYPDGKKVLGNVVLQLEDGRLKRMLEVQAFDE